MLLNRYSLSQRDSIIAATHYFQYFLKESPQESARIAKSWQSNKDKAEQDWNWIGNCSLAELNTKLSKVEVESEPLFSKYLERSKRGIVFTTLHMGNYLLGGLRLLSKLQGRKVVILRRVGHSEKEEKAFSKLESYGIRFKIIRHNQNTALQLFKSLRSGHIVIIPFDLPSRWGETLSLRFLDRRVNWVVGPAHLAFHTKSILVPFCVFRDQSVDVCAIDKILDLRLNNTGIKNHRDLAQYLVDFAAEEIRKRPDQWHQWYLAPEMLEQSNG